MTLEPKKLSIQDICVNSIGSLIAGIIGGILIIIITFAIGDIINVPGTFAEANLGLKTSAIFPIALSVITLIGTTATMFLTYFMLAFTDNQRYKKNVVILGQIAFFAFFTYLFVTPAYLYAGIQDYDYIMYVYLFHTIIIAFGSSILLETLNNYRYVLTGIYGSFTGLFVSSMLTFMIFNMFEKSEAKLMALIGLLPLINFSVTFFKQLFEFTYFYYYKYTNQDQLGDIFYQIEMEEKELLRDEENENLL